MSKLACIAKIPKLFYKKTAFLIFLLESVFHIEWPKNRIGLFVSSDTCFNVLPGSARYLVLDYFFNPQKAEADSIHLTTRHNAAVLVGLCLYLSNLFLLFYTNCIFQCCQY